MAVNSKSVAESDIDDTQEDLSAVDYMAVLVIEVSLYNIMFLSLTVSRDIILCVTTIRPLLICFSTQGSGGSLARVCECSNLRVVTANLPQRPLTKAKETSSTHCPTDTGLYQEELLPSQQHQYSFETLYPPRHSPRTMILLLLCTCLLCSAQYRVIAPSS